MMRLFDFNYHLPKVQEGLDLQAPTHSVALQQAIAQEYGLLDHDWQGLLADALKVSRRRCDAGAHLMVLDQRFAKAPACLDWMNRHRSGIVTALMDFRDPEVAAHIDNWAAAGGRGVKFHPYLQRITTADYSAVIHCAKLAQQKGLWINVDCSFGTLDLYHCNGPKLLTALLPQLDSIPVIALHFGGPRVLELMMLAMAAPNLYLDCSLSLSYWKGSTVEQDLAFAMGKLGTHRFLFGSDQPFINFQQSVTDMEVFIAKHTLTDEQAAWLWHGTALSLLSR